MRITHTRWRYRQSTELLLTCENAVRSRERWGRRRLRGHWWSLVVEWMAGRRPGEAWLGSVAIYAGRRRTVRRMLLRESKEGRRTRELGAWRAAGWETVTVMLTRLASRVSWVLARVAGIARIRAEVVERRAAWSRRKKTGRRVTEAGRSHAVAREGGEMVVWLRWRYVPRGATLILLTKASRIWRCRLR